jgi:hypothetical protein
MSRSIQQQTPTDPALQTHPSVTTRTQLRAGRIFTIEDEYAFLKNNQGASEKLAAIMPDYYRESAHKTHDAQLAAFELATREGRAYEGEIRSFDAINADFNKRLSAIESQRLKLALEAAPVIKAVQERFIIHAKRECERFEAEERAEAQSWGASNWFPSPKLVACQRLIKTLENRLATPGGVQASDTPRKQLKGLVDL